jgi:hypothetical protein
MMTFRFEVLQTTFILFPAGFLKVYVIPVFCHFVIIWVQRSYVIEFVLFLQQDSIVSGWVGQTRTTLSGAKENVCNYGLESLGEDVLLGTEMCMGRYY